MAATSPSSSVRLALRPAVEHRSSREVDGAWWPEGRDLATELPRLFALWPADRGRISRVLYSRPDWDDQPHVVALPDRRVKTGSFPEDDTHELVLMMLDGRRHRITVIAPSSTTAEAATAMDGMERDPKVLVRCWPTGDA